MRPGQLGAWMRSTGTSIVVAGLLCLAIANIVQRATWSEMEDGVLWHMVGGDVVADQIAPRTAADRAGLKPGDVLQEIDDQPVDRVEDVIAALQAATPGTRLRYT